MKKKNKEFLKTIAQAKETLKHYELRLASTAGKDVYIFKVDDIKVLKSVKGQTQLCNPIEGSLFSKLVAEEIFKKASFVNESGIPIKPVGAVLAETFFTEMVEEMQSVIEILNQALQTLVKSNK
jgi:hypothetical protein